VDEFFANLIGDMPRWITMPLGALALAGAVVWIFAG